MSTGQEKSGKSGKVRKSEKWAKLVRKSQEKWGNFDMVRKSQENQGSLLPKIFSGKLVSYPEVNFKWGGHSP